MPLTHDNFAQIRLGQAIRDFNPRSLFPNDSGGFVSIRCAEGRARWTGTDDSMIERAKRNALALSAGHSFVIFLGPGYFPVNVINVIKMVPEVCPVFCATANPVEVVNAKTDQGRGILGIIDGGKSKGIEDQAGITWRKNLLRQIGYKL